ncbi:hypothetical protein [Sphingomonas xinjiangensis]|uniref:Uncharacterized protein n=1 Tax=Sphingomonas xinjiangensis TaxID=643568 RepID=A0A840YQE4_9SPHN|nr:hypothetical protein [Sphingomonas xinjiangensis]MBB5710822.1 hypothetical protein [Sphingomonas xinjiangensis]
MQHYRVYKLSDVDGKIVTGDDLHAENDDEAMRAAEDDTNCPTCEVWTGAKRIGLIEKDAK